MTRSAQIECVSVVIPHFGNPVPTLQLVQRLHSQVAGPCIQLIVVDDKSPISFPETEGVTVVRRTSNGGFGAAVNSGMAIAHHQNVLVLNSDLEVESTFVADFIREAKPWLPAVCSPQVVGRDGESQWVGRHRPKTSHQFVEWLTPLARWRHLRFLHEAVGHDGRCVSGSIVPVDWVMGAAMLLPREEFMAVGGFDEEYFMNAEEVDLQFRLRNRGIPSIFLGTVEAVHEGGGSSDPERRRRWLVDARMRYARLWGSEYALRSSLVLATFINLGFNFLRRVTGSKVNPLSVAQLEFSLLKPLSKRAGGSVR